MRMIDKFEQRAESRSLSSSETQALEDLAAVAAFGAYFRMDQPLGARLHSGHSICDIHSLSALG